MSTFSKIKKLPQNVQELIQKTTYNRCHVLNSFQLRTNSMSKIIPLNLLLKLILKKRLHIFSEVYRLPLIPITIEIVI